MESQNRKKLALLVIGVLVIAGGIYVFLLTTASTTPNILADWKTYRNEKYEFEFRYPQA